MEPFSYHSHADLFPLLDGHEFDALVNDVKTNGLQIPIVLHDGKILDGRNRHRACLQAGVEPRFEEFDGDDDDALALVVSLNLTRRHLTTPQRAALALTLLPMEREQARRRMLAGGCGEEHPPQDPAGGIAKGEAMAIAGARVGISKETVRQAARVAEAAPDVIEAMRDGVVRSMPEAERLAGFDVERRTAVIGRMRDEGIRLKDADTVSTVWARGSGSCEWYTPVEILRCARDVMGGAFDLDPASSREAQDTVQAHRFFTFEDDGLAQDWSSERLWLNPPFNAVGPWISKVLTEAQGGRLKQAVMIVRAATEAAWFQPLWDHPLCFVRGRPRFAPGPGAPDPKNRPHIAVVIVGIGVDTDRFVEVFRWMGRVVLPHTYGSSSSSSAP